MNATLIKLGRTCHRLAGFARGVGRQVAAAGSELFRALPGGGFPDLYQYQVGLGEALELLHTDLVALEDRHAQDVQRCRELRDLRRNLVADLRAALSRWKQALSGALGPWAVRQLLRPVERLPNDPAELRRVAERLVAHLTDPALELRTVRPGVELDPLAMAQGFEPPMRQLGATLTELPDAEAAEQHSRTKKAEAQERLRRFAGRVERFYLALYEVTGNRRLAERLRKRAAGRRGSGGQEKTQRGCPRTTNS